MLVLYCSSALLLAILLLNGSHECIEAPCQLYRNSWPRPFLQKIPHACRNCCRQMTRCYYGLANCNSFTISLMDLELISPASSSISQICYFDLAKFPPGHHPHLNLIKFNSIFNNCTPNSTQFVVVKNVLVGCLTLSDFQLSTKVC